MALLSKPSSAARMSLAYITVGALMLVWTVVWYAYLHTYEPDWNYLYYICFGLMATGGVLLIIGLALGQIGRAARHAELPPPEVTLEMAKISEQATEAAAQATAVRAAAPGVMPVGGAMPVAVPPNTGVPVAQPQTGVPNTPPVAGKRR